jgi:hypothetical protein
LDSIFFLALSFVLLVQVPCFSKNSMKILTCLLCCWFFGGSATLAYNSTTTTSRVRVQIPHNLYDADGEEHVKAQFGFKTAQHGTITAQAYNARQELCAPLPHNRTSNWKQPFILLAERGGKCSFVSNARFAQEAGASALVLVDNHCLCADKDCVDQFKDDKSCQEHEPSLVDNGSAGDISIPTFLLHRSFGEKLKEASKNEHILMELTWGLKDKVETGEETLQLYYQLWTSGREQVLDLETYANLRTVTKAFSGKLNFEPHYSILDGTLFNCHEHSQEENSPCDHLCTNHGRYCAAHHKDLSGNAIVREALRRLCIWQHYGAADGSSTTWWDYVVYHEEHCYAAHVFASKDCLEAAMKATKIDVAKVDECMTDSGDVDSDVSNHLLDEQIAEQAESGVVTLPTITINREPLEHASSFSLFDTVCWHYWESNSPSVPKVCETCGSCPNVIGCLEQGKCVGFSNEERNKNVAPETKSRKHGWFFWSVLFLLIAGGGAWVYVKRRDEWGFGDRDRRGLLGGYMQLTGEG